MVSSLKSLSATKNEAQSQVISLKQQVTNGWMQVQVLRSELETATDFLLEQEQKVLEVGKLREKLAEKEHELAQLR